MYISKGNGIESKLTKEKTSHIENLLQSNSERFEMQIRLVERQAPLSGKKILDIGCGGGLFLSMAKQRGAKVTAIELSKFRVQYLKSKYNFEVVERPIEDAYWLKRYENF